MLLLALGVLASPLLLLPLAFVLAAVYRRVLAALRLDTYAHLPQPRHADAWLRSLVFGDLGAVQRAPPAEQHLAWGRELGDVFVYRSVQGVAATGRGRAATCGGPLRQRGSAAASAPCVRLLAEHLRV
jgi:hypothetical protein